MQSTAGASPLLHRADSRHEQSACGKSSSWQACQLYRWLSWPAKVTQGRSISAPQDAAAALAWLGTGENEEREPTPEETPSSQAGRLASAAEAAGEWVKRITAVL